MEIDLIDASNVHMDIQEIVVDIQEEGDLT